MALFMGCSEDLVDEGFEFAEGEGIGQFAQGVRQGVVAPGVVRGVGGVEEFPEPIADEGVVPGDGAHVGQFVAECHDLDFAGGAPEPLDAGKLAGAPGVGLALAVLQAVGLGGDDVGDAVAEFGSSWSGVIVATISTASIGCTI